MTAAVSNFADFARFSELRLAAEQGDQGTLREVAGQFEALFLESMLKSMRDASMGDPLFGDDNAHDMYEGMLDQQLAMELAGGKGIGLAEMLVRQLGGEQAVRRPVRTDLMFERTGPASESKAAWKTPESFARDVWPHAKRVAEQLNVPAEGVLAQAALETGWGRHVMPDSRGHSSFNLFGIKAGKNWHGGSVFKNTIEFESGVALQERARFRAYDSIAQTFADYAAMLGDNPRYAGVKDHGDDVAGFADALQQSGYATDPAYAHKISRVASSDTMQRVLAGLKNTSQAPIAP